MRNDGIDTIERWPRRPPQAAFVSLLASRHPRDGSHSRPLCGCRDRGPADDELAELERLIEVPDPDLYAALTGDTPLDPEYATALFDRIKAFRAVDHDA